MKVLDILVWSLSSRLYRDFLSTVRTFKFGIWMCIIREDQESYFLVILTYNFEVTGRIEKAHFWPFSHFGPFVLSIVVWLMSYILL